MLVYQIYALVCLSRGDRVGFQQPRTRDGCLEGGKDPNRWVLRFRGSLQGSFFAFAHIFL